MSTRVFLSIATSVALSVTAAISCSGPIGPTGTTTVDQLMQMLRDRGLTVRQRLRRARR
jgi:hypothetical protein